VISWVNTHKKVPFFYGVGIYDLNDNLVLKFKNNVELAKHLNISSFPSFTSFFLTYSKGKRWKRWVTVGKYLISGLIYNKTYRFKVNNK